jgi:prevent-host-death family protein
MRFATVAQLKNKTSDILRSTQDGETVIITKRGKPEAVMVRIREEDLEDWVLAHSPAVKAELDQLYAECVAGEAIPVEELLAKHGVKR